MAQFGDYQMTVFTLMVSGCLDGKTYKNKVIKNKIMNIKIKYVQDIK